MHAKPGSQPLSSRLRLLDFDDLFLLEHLLTGQTIAATAKRLGLTQPAITQRVRKIERVFGEAILQKVGRHVKLTLAGRAVCTKAASALAIMGEEEFEEKSASTTLTLGVEASWPRQWLTPVLTALRLEEPEVSCNLFMYQSQADQPSTLIQSGTVDAALVVHAPDANDLVNDSFSAIHLTEIDYVAVASPGVALTIDSLASLSQQTLLDLDRFLPLFGHVSPEYRPLLRFRNKWLLGSFTAIKEAAVSGHGVAFLPRALVASAVASNQLKLVVPEILLQSDALSLVHSRLLPESTRLAVAALRTGLQQALRPKTF
jgi:DNA-binding transcriptional LysR family regulator